MALRLKTIDQALSKLDTKPLTGSRNIIDLDVFSSILSDKFETTIQLKIGDVKWESPPFHLKENDDFIPFTFAPAEGDAFWVMNRQDIAKLISHIMTDEKDHPGFSSEILVEGYYHYLLTHVLDALIETPYFQNFSPKMNASTPLLTEGALVIDIGIKIKNTHVWGKILLSKTFQSSIQRLFSKITENPFNAQMAQNLQLNFGVKVGNVKLTLDEMEKIEPGDFVIPDYLDFDLESASGDGVLMLGQSPLFSLNINNQKVKISDKAISRNEEPMESEPDIEKEEEKESGVSLKKLPLCVDVEIARIQMSLEELMKLEPGNFIELPSESGANAHLTINGKKVGTAELVYLGDVLGLRILDLA